METNPEFKQLIPYVIFHFNGLVFSYLRKSGGEKRLDDLYSIGIGGHVEKQDEEQLRREIVVGTDPFIRIGRSTVPATSFYRGLAREIEEEVEIKCPFDIQVVGLLNEDTSDVGRVHLGIVCLATLQGAQIASREAELSQGGLMSMGDLKTRQGKYEGWSKYLIDAMPGVVADLKPQQ
jgi:predicted NUDIX family phosphoesterase